MGGPAPRLQHWRPRGQPPRLLFVGPRVRSLGVYFGPEGPVPLSLPEVLVLKNNFSSILANLLLSNDGVRTQGRERGLAQSESPERVINLQNPMSE